MAIRLSVQAHDDEVERLLTWLDARQGMYTEDKISLLERTLVWLRAATEACYGLSPDPQAVFQIDVDARAPEVSESVRMLSGPI